MGLGRRYVIITALVSIGWYVIYRTRDLQPGFLIVMMGSLLLSYAEWYKPVPQVRLPKWDTKGFFSGVAHVLSFVLLFVIGFMVLLCLPHEQLRTLLGTWYFAGTNWLWWLSVVAVRFLQEREKARTEGGSPSQSTDAVNNEKGASSQLPSSWP